MALTPDHVKTHDLPISPLKDSEKRKDRWKERMGVEQTEIDALAALNPRIREAMSRAQNGASS